MTKEEIIEECKQRLGFETDCEMYSLCQHEKDFYNAIIKVLEQRSSEDCVSRQAVHNMLEDIPIVDTDKWFNWLQKACLRLAELPPATWNAPYKGAENGSN